MDAKKVPDVRRDVYRRGERIIQSAHLPRTKVLLHLWAMPAFGWGEPIAWKVFIKNTARYSNRNELPAHYLHRVTWKRSEDMERLRDKAASTFDSDPTLLIQEAPLDMIEYQAYIEAGRQISLPVIGVEPLEGLDGIVWGLEMPEVGSRLTWWTVGPPEWEALTRWAASLRRYFDETLNGKEG
jgi:hypothetical protein